MVADLFKKVKEWAQDNQKDLFIALIIFFTGLSSFGLGRLSVDIRPAAPVSIIDTASGLDSVAEKPTAADHSDKRVAASRNGTTYYYSWCSGLKRIKDENKIWFPTKEAAEKAGLRQAANCSGL